MSVISVRLNDELVSALEALAQKLDRSKNDLINQAIKDYIERQNSDDQRWTETLEALEGVRSGELIEGQHVAQWLSSWGTENELNAPTQRYVKQVQQALALQAMVEAAQAIQSSPQLQQHIAEMNDEFSVTEADLVLSVSEAQTHVAVDSTSENVDEIKTSLLQARFFNAQQVIADSQTLDGEVFFDGLIRGKYDE